MERFRPRAYRLLSVALGCILFLPTMAVSDAWRTKATEDSFQLYHEHIYPLCFYDTDLGAVQAGRRLWGSYPEVLEGVLMMKSRRLTSFQIVSSRSVLVRTTLNHHRELLTFWPDVACIGRTSGSASVALLNVCKSYVDAFVRSQIHHDPLSPGIPEPVCQTFLPDAE